MSETQTADKKAEQQPPPRVRRKLVYAGVARGESHPKVYRWYFLNEDGTLEEPANTWIFAPKKRGRDQPVGASVGQVYSFDFDPDYQSVYTSSYRYEGKFHDPNVAVEWAAVSRALEAQMELDARAKKEKKDADLETLDPIRSAYNKLPFFHRQLYLAQVVEYITRPRRDD